MPEAACLFPGRRQSIDAPCIPAGANTHTGQALARRTTPKICSPNKRRPDGSWMNVDRALTQNSKG